MKKARKFTWIGRGDYAPASASDSVPLNIILLQCSRAFEASGLTSIAR
jgi:hypothetical protein